MAKKKFLSIEEKRSWLAGIFRDISGEYSQADKFKAMIEDTRLAVLASEAEKPSTPMLTGMSAELLAHLPPPLQPGDAALPFRSETAGASAKKPPEYG